MESLAYALLTAVIIGLPLIIAAMTLTKYDVVYTHSSDTDTWQLVNDSHHDAL